MNDTGTIFEAFMTTNVLSQDAVEEIYHAQSSLIDQSVMVPIWALCVVAGFLMFLLLLRFGRRKDLK